MNLTSEAPLSSLPPSSRPRQDRMESDDLMCKVSLDESVGKDPQDGRAPSLGAIDPASSETYRLYKRRWVGVAAICLLNIVSGMVLVWFGPIANDMVRDFGYSLNAVNWLGNVVNLVYLPCSFIVPYLYGRLGTRVTCFVGAALFILSGWIRYVGTAQSLSVGASYAFVIVGQLLAGMAVPIFQIIVPSYSEKWFDLKGRTTATMIMGIANPVGNALGQLIPPLVSTRQSLLVMAIIFSAAAPAVLFVGNAPPTPPSMTLHHSGRAVQDEYTYMTMRQRIDFGIISLVFGVVVGVINAFTVLTAQYLEPYGYSDTISGLMGAVLLLVGLVAAAITSPLYDRVLTHHLALSLKLLCPILAACWIALIWERLTLLPAVLELAVELTRNADGSSAILWASTNACGLVFVVVEGALRAGSDGSPALNMHRSAIFQASVVAAVIIPLYLVEGKQTRRARDEEMNRALTGGSPDPTDRAEAGTAVEVMEVQDGGSGRSSEDIQPVTREVDDRRDA
ncbi:MFS general substrate transporter [Trametes gibbosa]|nr:MFS general substrate transporter [Trametes gibbosa]